MTDFDYFRDLLLYELEHEGLEAHVSKGHEVLINDLHDPNIHASTLGLLCVSKAMERIRLVASKYIAVGEADSGDLAPAWKLCLIGLKFTELSNWQIGESCEDFEGFQKFELSNSAADCLKGFQSACGLSFISSEFRWDEFVDIVELLQIRSEYNARGVEDYTAIVAPLTMRFAGIETKKLASHMPSDLPIDALLKSDNQEASVSTICNWHLGRARERKLAARDRGYFNVSTAIMPMWIVKLADEITHGDLSRLDGAHPLIDLNIEILENCSSAKGVDDELSVLANEAYLKHYSMAGEPDYRAFWYKFKHQKII